MMPNSPKNTKFWAKMGFYRKESKFWPSYALIVKAEHQQHYV